MDFAETYGEIQKEKKAEAQEKSANPEAKGTKETAIDEKKCGGLVNKAAAIGEEKCGALVKKEAALGKENGSSIFNIADDKHIEKIMECTSIKATDSLEDILKKYNVVDET